MKRVLPFLLIMFVTSCSKSKEEKAAELIKEELFNILIDYPSYEPIGLEIDSSFTDIYRDTLILNEAIEIDVHQEHLQDLREQAEEAQKSFDIWVNVRSDEGRQRLIEAKSELYDIWNKFRYTTVANCKSTERLKRLIDGFVPRYEGWKANHRFRCKTQEGNYAIADYTFYFDEDMTQITELYTGNEEMYERMTKIIDEVKSKEIDKEKEEERIEKLDDYIKRFE